MVIGNHHVVAGKRLKVLLLSIILWSLVLQQTTRGSCHTVALRIYKISKQIKVREKAQSFTNFPLLYWISYIF